MTHKRPDIFLHGLHRRRRTEACAFTLIEIIVVIAIIALLVTLTVGMSKYLSTRSGVQKTQGIQIVFMHALDAFIEDGGQDRNDAFTVPGGDYDLIRTPFDGGDPNDPNYSGCKFVMSRLRETPFAVDKLRALPEGAIDQNDPNILYDGFEQQMLYDHNGGLGGRPVLISAGPDRKFRTDDDIHSDKH